MTDLTFYMGFAILSINVMKDSQNSFSLLSVYDLNWKILLGQWEKPFNYTTQACSIIYKLKLICKTIKQHN